MLVALGWLLLWSRQQRVTLGEAARTLLERCGTALRIEMDEGRVAAEDDLVEIEEARRNSG